MTATKESDLSIIRKYLIDINSSVDLEQDEKEYPVVIDKKIVYNFSSVEQEIKEARLFPSLDILIEFESVINKLLKKHGEPAFKYTEIIQLFKFYCDFEHLYSFRDLSKYLRVANSIYYEPCNDLNTYFHFNNAPIRFSKITIHYAFLFLKQKIENGIVKIPEELIITLNDAISKKNLTYEYLREIEDYYNCIIFINIRLGDLYIFKLQI